MPSADRRLMLCLVFMVGASVAAQVVLPISRFGLSRPGDPLRHVLGTLGSLLMLFGLTFPLIKRTRLSFLKMFWNPIHMVLGVLGVAMVTIHAAGHWGKPPTLLWLAAVAMVMAGAYGRLLSGRFVHAQFVSDPYAFLPARGDEAAAIRAIVVQKERLLPRIDPRANEAVFTLAPHHWVRRPLLAARYARLAWREGRLVHERANRSEGVHDLVQRSWRALHIALALLVLIGLVAHIVTVTFFAGYAAGGGEVYWWHLRR